MNGHLPIVALELRIAGWTLGAPASLSTLGLTIGALVLRQTPGVDVAAHDLDIRTYGLAALIENSARGVARAFEFLAGAAAWVVAALAIVSLAATLVAVLTYCAGRGIQRHATWARIVAIAIFLGSLALALGALSVLAPVDGLLIGVSLYSLWVLVWKFG